MGDQPTTPAEKRAYLLRELHRKPSIMACGYPTRECTCAAVDYVDRLITSGVLEHGWTPEADSRP